MKELYRIAKFIAASGYCSRRSAENIIAENRVSVNGVVITDFAIKVSEDDCIRIDGKEIRLASAIRLWMYNKPAGMIISHSDPEGRRTVFNSLPSTMPRVISVGRLDYNSEGLLLLTNSGALAHVLEKPNHKIVREYKCRISGTLQDNEIKILAQGIVIDGFRYSGIKAKTISTQGRNSWIMLSLTEGKNREIRRVMEYFGLDVSRLIRVRYGKFMLQDLPKEGIMEVDASHFAEYL